MAKKNVITPGGTRTRNPQIRSLMRYPLRHWGIKILARADVPSPWVHCSSAPFRFLVAAGQKRSTVQNVCRIVMRPWRNGSALDSRPKGWGFESLWPHIFLFHDSGKLRRIFFWFAKKKRRTTPAGFEPARTKSTHLAGERLNHSAKVSMAPRRQRTGARALCCAP